MQNTESAPKRASSTPHFTGTIVAAGVALFLLVGLSAQPKDSKQPRPFRFTAIELPGIDNGVTGTYLHVGNATYMGKVISAGPWTITGEKDGVYFFHIQGNMIAANYKDVIRVVSDDYGVDYNVVPPVGTGTVQITGGRGTFAEATGELNALVIYTDPPQVLFEGTICY